LIVILEGTDGVGKTTAAHQLAVGNHSALLHPGPPKSDDPIREYLYPLARLVRAGYDVVCDRWHIGEMVWPHVFGRVPLMTLSQMHGLEDVMKAMSPTLLVHVVADVGWLESIAKYRQDEENLTQTVKAMAAFTNVIKQSELDAITCTRHNVIEEVTSWKSTQSTHQKP